MASLVQAIAPLRQQLATIRRSATTIGFVPTMGALHAGHARLIEHARRECGHVVVSVFVNPLQFDRREDLAAYPRTLEADLELCDRHGVDTLFAPSPDQIYPEAPICAVDPGRLADHLCGRFRPGHFRGVATVVLKLFQIVQADAAYFGEKDAQQLAVVRRMVRDFEVPVRIVGVPTVREADGLALSSRNRHLDAGERALAPALHRALLDAVAALAGGVVDAGVVRQRAIATIPADPRLRLEYLEIVDADEFQPVTRITGPAVVAGALWVGTTRLIDNVRWEG